MLANIAMLYVSAINKFYSEKDFHEMVQIWHLVFARNMYICANVSAALCFKMLSPPPPPPATYCFHLKRTKHVHGKAVLVLHKGLLSESYDCHDAVVSVRKNGPFVVRPFPCHLFWGSTAVKCEESAAVQSLLFHNFYILFFWGEELSSLAVVYSLTLPSLQWKTHESFMKLMLFATQTIVTLFVSALKKRSKLKTGRWHQCSGNVDKHTSVLFKHIHQRKWQLFAF